MATGLGKAAILATCLLALRAAAVFGKEPVDYADPRVDSAHSRWIFFSSACRPFAMVNLSPDTNPDADAASNSSYCYHKGSVCGLSHVHAWQLGGVSVMPVAGEVDPTAGPEAFRSPFRHDDEVCRSGYHAITLDRYRIRVELTSTPRVGFHRYRYPNDDKGRVAINLAEGTISVPVPDAMLRRVGDAEIEGYQVNGPTGRRPKPCTVYFVARFDRPIRDLTGWIGKQNLGLVQQVTGKNCGAIVRCTLGADRLLQMKVGLSYVSIEQARRNLDAELPHWDFDRVQRESREVWNQWLGKIEIEGGSARQRKKFYTDLWHALLGRRLTSDVNGQYCDMTGPAPRVRQIPLDAHGRPRYQHYNSDAFWMTFWNLNQLWGITYPRTYSEFVHFLLDMYRDGGLIPRGPAGHNYSFVMIAAHSTPLIVGAYMKGIRDFDAATAYEGMRKNHFPGGLMGHGHYEHGSAKQGGIEDYLHYGYVPLDGRPKGWIAESASATLEYAYDDWCLAQMAQVLGKEDDYWMFLHRAENYRNLFDRQSGFMRPRRCDGSWLSPFDPLSSKYWCETNAWQFTWFVPHDVEGLIRLMGGRETFNRRLDEIFQRSVAANFVAPSPSNLGYVDYSNQPSTAMAHLFNYSGAPWLAQKWVREVKERTFSGVTPDLGYRGDEDQGQMGALGVMMAMGLFQVRGGAELDPVYEITSPIFDRITIHLDPDYYPGGKFVIVAHNNSPKNRYIQSALLDGRPLTRPWFYHRDLVKGGTLELVLGPQPNKDWGSRSEDTPPSMTPTSDTPQVGSSPVELRGYGRVQASITPQRSEFVCESTTKADILLGKLLADLFWDTGPDHVATTVTIAGRNVVVHQWPPYGAMVAARNENRVLVIGGKDRQEAIGLASKEPLLATAGTLFTPLRPYPKYLDFYDLGAVKCDTLDLHPENKFRYRERAAFTSRFFAGGLQGFSMFLRSEPAEGVNSGLSLLDTDVLLAKKNDQMYSLGIGTGLCPEWVRNRWPDAVDRSSPIHEPNAAVYFEGPPEAFGVSDQKRRQTSLGFLRDIVRRYRDCPVLGGWQLYCGDYTWESFFMKSVQGHYGNTPGGRDAFRRWLRDVRGLSLAGLNQRWYGDAAHFHDWSEVAPPDPDEFFGDFGAASFPIRDSWFWKRAEAGQFERPADNAPGWTPVPMPPSEQMLALPPGPSFWRAAFDPGPWLKKNAGKEVYLVFNVDNQGWRKTNVWLNDASLGEFQSKADPFFGPFGLKITGLLKSGGNKLWLQVVGGGNPIGPVFLTTTQPRAYPYLGKYRNAQFRDALEWRLYELNSKEINAMAYTRSIDPDRPLVVCATGNDVKDAQGMALRQYGGSMQDTGYESSYRPLNSRLGYAAGFYGSCEQSGISGIEHPAEYVPVMTRRLSWLLLNGEGSYMEWRDPYCYGSSGIWVGRKYS